MDLWKRSATELIDGYERGDFTCAEVMADVVERIRAVNPQVNAIVVDLGDAAMAAAEAADERPGGRRAARPAPRRARHHQAEPGRRGPAHAERPPGPRRHHRPGRLRRRRQPAPGRRHLRRPDQRARALDALHHVQPHRRPDPQPVAPGRLAGRLVGRRRRGHRGRLRPDPPRQRHRGLAPGPGLVQRRDDHQAQPGSAARVQPDRHGGAGPAVVAHVGPGRAGPDRRRRAPGHPRHGRPRPPGPLVAARALRRTAPRATAAGGGDDEPARLPDRPPDHRPGRPGRGAPGRRRLRRGGGRAAADHRPRPRVDEHRHHRDQADARCVGPRPRQRRAGRRLRRLLRHGRAGRPGRLPRRAAPTGPA